MENRLLCEVDRAVGEALREGAPQCGASGCGAVILCAVSGGPDSMALLHALLRLREKRGFSLAAAHFNHGIREAAAADEAFVHEQCALRGVPLTVGRADVPNIAAQTGKTLEQAARDERYAFLRQAAKEAGARWIALGHHMDDQAETVLLNLLRGAGASGLRAMRVLRGDLLRPMLAIRRSDIMDYLRQNAVPYRIDETNESPDHTRNRVRRLIASFEEENPGFVEGAARTAELLARDDDALNALAQALLSANPRGTGIDAQAAAQALPAVGARVIRLLAAEAGLAQDLEQKHVQAVLDLCGTGRTGASLCLPRGYEARLDYGALSILPAAAIEAVEPVPFNPDGPTHTPAGDFVARLEPRPGNLAQGWPLTVYCNPDAFCGASVRTRREGDRIAPLGARGSKKLKDFLIDKKIDRRLRSLPVVAIGPDVLWVVGGAISHGARVADQQTVLRIQFLPAPDSELAELYTFD